MLNKVIEVLENSWNEELKGCKGYIKEILPNGMYRVVLTSKYYGKVYLNENEFAIVD